MLIDKVIIHNYVDRQSLHIKTVARQMTNINIHVRYTFFRITFFPFTKKIKVDFNLSIFLFLQVHLDRKYSDLDQLFPVVEPVVFFFISVYIPPNEEHMGYTVTKYLFRHNIYSKEILLCNHFAIWNQFHVIFFPCV